MNCFDRQKEFDTTEALMLEKQDRGIRLRESIYTESIYADDNNDLNKGNEEGRYGGINIFQ